MPEYLPEYVEALEGALKERVTMTTNDAMTTTFEQRLQALDRAINRLHADREATPDDVVALAVKFEQYLTRAEDPGLYEAGYEAGRDDGRDYG